MTLGLGQRRHRALLAHMYKSLFASFSSEKEGSSSRQHPALKLKPAYHAAICHLAPEFYQPAG